VPEATWDQLDDEAAQLAWKVAGVAQADVAQQVYDSIDSAIKNGETLKDFRERVGASLISQWGGEKPGRIETIFRTNILGSYNAGRHAIMSEPHVLEDRPYWRFDGVEDNRQTPICEYCDGTILPADHPWWKSFYPGLHHACRSTVTPLSREEAEEGGISPGPPDTHGERPQEGFGKPPAQAGRWDPKPDDYDPRIRDVLAGRLGE
jgi:SPP1 gp7 family putative phage head morphogenesis protein